MKLQIIGKQDELRDKATDILKAVAERIPSTPETQAVLELLKAIRPTKEQELKHPALRALEKEMSTFVSSQHEAMLKEIGQVLDGKIKKAEVYDHTKPLHDADAEKYDRVKAALYGLGYKAKDFEEGGKLYGESVNQLVDRWRSESVSKATDHLSKAKEMIGTVHRWSDGRVMRKVAEGDWEEAEHPHNKHAEEGKVHEIKVHPKMNIHAGTTRRMKVKKVADGKAHLEHADGSRGPSMPARSIRHYIADMEGRVEGPESDHPEIKAVLAGKGELLGKGDDGLVFKVGDKVVKVSTTVPFHPDNPGHRTPEGAAEMLEHQKEVADQLIKLGIKGIQESELVRHGEKAFQIKPYVEIPEKLSQAQLDETQEIVRKMHEKGWALNDQIQVGLQDGKIVMFDIGKAALAREGKGLFKDADKEGDIDNLKIFYRQHGGDYEPKGGAAKEMWEASIFGTGPFADRSELTKRAKIPTMAKIARKKLESARKAYTAEVQRTMEDPEREFELEDIQTDYDAATKILDEAVTKAFGDEPLEPPDEPGAEAPKKPQSDKDVEDEIEREQEKDLIDEDEDEEDEPEVKEG